MLVSRLPYPVGRMHVVTGMHRSGTSLLAMWLAAAGAPTAPMSEFYGADEHNPRGYFEEKVLIDLNSLMLTGRPRTTGTRASHAAASAAYLRGPNSDDVARRSNALAPQLQNYANNRSGVLVKDPRLCLTLPHWITHTGPAETVSVAVRHPASVAASLNRRQRIPGRVAHRFWRMHMESVLSWAGSETVFVDMDDVMAGGPHTATAALAVQFADASTPITTSQLEQAFPEVFAEQLVNSVAPAPLDGPTNAIYQRLKERCT